MNWRAHAVKALKQIFNTSSDRATDTPPVILIQQDNHRHNGCTGSLLTMSDGSIWFHDNRGYAPICLKEAK